MKPVQHRDTHVELSQVEALLNTNSHISQLDHCCVQDPEQAGPCFQDKTPKIFLLLPTRVNVLVDPTAGRGAVFVSLLCVCPAVLPQIEKQEEKFQNTWNSPTFVQLRYLM